MNKDGARDGDVASMREALQNGAAVNARSDILDKTPFLEACYYCTCGQLEAVRFLSTVPGNNVNAVDHEGKTGFYWACSEGNHDVVDLLLTLPGINILTVGASSGDESCCLQFAIKEGNLEVVQYLLSSNIGFDVEARNGEGQTALHLACLHGRLEIIKYLLKEHKADLQAIDQTGKTAFFTRPSRKTASK